MPATEASLDTPNSRPHTPSVIPGLKSQSQYQHHATNESSNIEASGGVAEGKQKAQAVMAAHLGTDAQNSHHGDSRNPAPTGDPLQSRKRSRSGSRILYSSRQEAHDRLAGYLFDQYTQRDQQHAAALKQQAEHREALIKTMNDDIQLWKDVRKATVLDPGRVYGEGFSGHGNGWTAQYPTRVIYPAHRKRPGARICRELRIVRKDRAIQSEQLEELVPIRLDVELEKLRLKDTFTWNVFDRVVPLDLFAEGLVEDMRIPPQAGHAFTQLVLQALHEQIADYHPHPFFEEEPLDPHSPYTAYKNDEIRVLIKLNINIGKHTLVDQFDWDINNHTNSPEDFAIRMTTDLSLSGEFMTAIAHSIREQAQMFTRSLYLTGHTFDGRPLDDAELKENLLPSPLPSSFRSVMTIREYTPYFYELTDADVERAELALSREQRMQKRSVNRRGGPTMPDLKDRQSTVRSLLVSSVIPGAAESNEESGIFKPTRAPTGRGRRQYKADHGDDTDVSESEESDADSPVRYANQGTARTRGIRGAASAATAAMKASLNAGSMTPEIHYQESRTSRRTGGYELRENSIGEPSLLLRLKMPRQKYRVWWRNYKLALQQRQVSQPPQHFIGAASGFTNSRASTPHHGTPAPPGAMAPPPPQTPGMQNRHLVGQQYQGPLSYAVPSQQPTTNNPSQHRQQFQQPAVDVPSLPSSGSSGIQPQPPTWLTNALPTLRAEYPHDSFTATMRWNASMNEWQPRLRCNDCTGMLYNTVAEDPTRNFRVHLRNGSHREKVEARTKNDGGDMGR